MATIRLTVKTLVWPETLTSRDTVTVVKNVNVNIVKKDSIQEMLSLIQIRRL